MGKEAQPGVPQQPVERAVLRVQDPAPDDGRDDDRQHLRQVDAGTQDRSDRCPNRFAMTSKRAAATSSPRIAGTTAIAATSSTLCQIDAQNSESWRSWR